MSGSVAMASRRKELADQREALERKRREREAEIQRLRTLIELAGRKRRYVAPCMVQADAGKQRVISSGAERHAAAFILRKWGMTYREIAEHMEVSLERVRQIHAGAVQSVQAIRLNLARRPVWRHPQGGRADVQRVLKRFFVGERGYCG